MEIVNLKKVTTDTNVNYFVVVGLTKNKYEEIKDDINKSYSYIDSKVKEEEVKSVTDVNVKTYENKEAILTEEVDKVSTLKTNINTADNAPSPPSNANGFCPSNHDKRIIKPIA